MASITLSNIVKQYGNGVIAVDGFNMEILDEEFIVLVGPSGCGKSTVLRMIAGLEEITRGEIYIDEEPVNDVLPKDRNIAMVFQNYALYPHMNVYKNMAFGLKMRKMSKKAINERIELTAKQLKIEDLLKRKPAELSGGQRQRVALGRAMVREPKVFLLDEPLSNLDAKLRTEMRIQISSLHKELKTTFIYVTHDQTEAMTMADRMVVMKDGKILQIGTPLEIYKNPVSLFVADFIGLPGINILPAEIVRGDCGFDLKICGATQHLEDGFLSHLILGACEGKKLVIGLRPEAVVVRKQGLTGRKAFVEMVEELGSETYLYLNYEGNRVTAKKPDEQNLKMEEEVDLEFKILNLQLFDDETGINLCV